MVTGELDLRLLSAFIAYSVVILGVGVWGYRKKSFEAYAVADRSMGFGLATTAFVATFLSAVTIIGDEKNITYPFTFLYSS